MTDTVTALTTEHLRIMREDIAAFRAEVKRDMQEGFADIRKRISYVEHSVTGLKRDEALAAAEMTDYRQLFDRMAATISDMHNTIDQLRERIHTLETRATH